MRVRGTTTGLQAEEFLLAYRLRGYAVTSAAPAFYFQEGIGHQYAGAKFGVFKLAADGKTLLVGLCDEGGRVIGGGNTH